MTFTKCFTLLEYSIFRNLNSKLMRRHNNHPFHLVDTRPWPIIGAIGVLIIITGLIKWFHLYKQELILIGIRIIILTIIQWWLDIVREGTYQGLHTFVTKGLRRGVILFISEVFCFFSFFWASFHRLNWNWIFMTSYCNFSELSFIDWIEIGS